MCLCDTSCSKEACLFFHGFSADGKHCYHKASNFSASTTLLCSSPACSASLSCLLIDGGRGRKLVIGTACPKVFDVRNQRGPSALIHISEIIKELQSQLLGAPGNVTPYGSKSSHGKGFRSGSCLPALFLQQTGERD